MPSSVGESWSKTIRCGRRRNEPARESSSAPDQEVFPKYRFRRQFLEDRLWNYAFLNRGLTLHFDGQAILSKKGLLDLLSREVEDGALYAPIHEVNDSIEFTLTHTDSYGESYLSFVNGQYTPDGGTHQAAFREGILKGLKEFFNRQMEPSDARNGIVGAVLVRIHEPVFESQTKTKLGSTHISPEGPTVRSWLVEHVPRPALYPSAQEFRDGS